MTMICANESEKETDSDFHCAGGCSFNWHFCWDGFNFSTLPILFFFVLLKSQSERISIWAKCMQMKTENRKSKFRTVSLHSNWVDFDFHYQPKRTNLSPGSAKCWNVYTIVYGFSILFAAVALPLHLFLSLFLSLYLPDENSSSWTWSCLGFIVNVSVSVEDVHCNQFQLGILFYIWILKFLPHRRQQATGKWTICVCGNWLANTRFVRPNG